MGDGGKAINKAEITETSVVVDELMGITGCWQSIVFDYPVESSLDVYIKGVSSGAAVGSYTTWIRSINSGTSVISQFNYYEENRLNQVTSGIRFFEITSITPNEDNKYIYTF